ncbi:MAG: InlB B-repeat-containing protein [Oscillospiraceae bacterium]|nr:InlB B-repeat-containing protein [Oscillospiraceae bacterium]
MFPKKTLSLLLTVALCLSMVQASAFAITSDTTDSDTGAALMPNGIQLTIPQSTEATDKSSPEPTATPNSEPTVESAPEVTTAQSPEPTTAPSPEPTAAPSPNPTVIPAQEPVVQAAEPTAKSIKEGTPEPSSTPAPLPTAEILAESDGMTVYAVVKVLFSCEQSEDLSGLQIYDSNWQPVSPYTDPSTLQPVYGTYYLAPGIYAYSFRDESGKFEAIEYTPFLVEWDKPERKVDLVLTPAPSVMDQIIDMEVHSVTMVNPIYEAVLDTSDIPGASTTPDECADLLQQIGDTIADYVEANTGNQASYSVTFQAAPSALFSSADTFYQDTSSAGSALKNAMIARNSEIRIFYQSSEQLNWNTLCSNIYANAVSHTGAPTEGDYLLYEFGGYNATGAGPVKLDGSNQYSYLFNYAPLYYTTAAQESEMTSKVNSVLSQLNLSGKTDYQKIKAIYDYLCANVTYDDAHASDAAYTLKYTGYAALVQKTAVCQGYSVAFYRLCLEAGVNARVIDSKAMQHAWNIARVGSKYYHLDATWDAGRSNYLYFLRGNTWWLQNHKQSGLSYKGDKFNSASFASSYPVPDTDYSESTTTDPEEEPEPSEYQILYECNGGTNAKENPASYTGEEELTLLAPSRTGYTFEGWYQTSSLSGTPVSVLSSGTTGNLTLYAKWKANTYTVIYDPNGGAGSHRSQTMTYDRQVALTANSFRKDGAAFAGWSVNPSATTYEYTDRQSVSNLTAEAGGTVTLFAVWMTNGYFLAFNPNGGSGEMASLRYTYGTAYTLPACTFTREGYTFDGWATAARGKVVYDNGASVSNLTTGNGQTVTLYAVWAAHSYTIQFDGNGATSGTMRALENRLYGNTVTLTSNAYRRTGYTFTGWNTAPDGSGTAYTNRARQANFASGDGSVITLYAQWAPLSYNITYRNVTASDNNPNPTVYTAKDAAITLSGLSRSGYIFGGWYSDSRYTNPVTSIPQGTTGNLTFYAQWLPYSYTIVFEANGGTGTMDPLSGCIASRSYSLKNNVFKRAGYTFTGWNTAPDGSGNSYANRARVTSLATENGAIVTLYAQWAEVTYRITYRNILSSDSNPNPAAYTTKQSVVLQAPSRAGYLFSGWYSDSSFRTPVITINENKSGSGAVTVYAKWTQLKYNIAFDSNAQGRGKVTGTMRDLTNRLFGRTYALTSNSFRLPGYVFLGWSTDPNAGTPTYLNRARVTDLASSNNETVTLYAVWSPAG